MTKGWRLVKAVQAERALDGEGSRRYGGRWNFSGIAVVYLSESLALAALEAFVHLGKASAGIDFAAFPVQIPDSVGIEEVDRKRLPPDWRVEPPPDSTQQIGTEWVTGGRSAVLRIPSVLVPSESNFIVNIAHPDFKSLEIGDPEPFWFDPRMWR